MPKYIIEGGIQFYDELYKSISLSTNDENYNTDNNCLISNEPLTENFVTLECNHKFNYLPLYKDILNHKKKFNVLESRALKTIELRCPYCKNIQKKLLPYIELPGVKQIHGVNFYDNTIMLNKGGLKLMVGECQFENCLNTNILLCHDNKYYCMYHKYNIINEYYLKKKNEIKEKKLAEQDAKIKQKQQLKDDKAKAKQIKEDKLKQLKENKEKEVKILCSQILKTGKNAGTQCQCKAVTNNLCNRHSSKIIAV